jgi:hypothetical protein
MKGLKEILLERLKVSKSNQYSYESCDWNWDMLERLLTFIIYDDNITDSFFDVNNGQKIPECCITFFSEDEDGNEIDFPGLYQYNNGKNLREIPFEQDDIEDLFGTLDFGDSVNIYYYFNGNDVKTIIYEVYSDGSWYYSIFGDKEIDKVLNLFPDNLVQDESDIRSLLQAYEFYLKDN